MPYDAKELMRQLTLEPRAKALVVVAHPDDETIWMGGTILKNPAARWTIFSLCRSGDRDRAPKFRRVCKHYGAVAIISNLEDEGTMTVNESIPEIERRLLAKLAGRRFDYIFTHGANGEYGHPRHVGVHRTITKMLRSRNLVGKEVFFFSYRADSRKRMRNIAKPAAFFTLLTQEELRAKRNIVKNRYGFSRASFENVSCLPQETFIGR